MYTWKINKWTSDLIISADIDLNDSIKSDIIFILDYIESRYSNFIDKKLQDEMNILPGFYHKFGVNNDLTCMLKGLAIDEIRKILLGNMSRSHIISFGGDIFGYNTNACIHIDQTKFDIDINGTFSVFTSGNTDKRGNHISGCPEGRFITYIVKWNNEEDIDNITVDILATKFAANEFIGELEFIKDKNYVNTLEFMDGNMINMTYIASPFFNPQQIKTRDDMIIQFNQIYRPDQTPSSKLYDGDHGDSSLVEKVVEENIYGIEIADCLVYPKDTTDLGTLFEVGYAIANNKLIIQFDGESYNIITENIFKDIEINKDQHYLFDCNRKIQAILLGYLSKFVDKSHIQYELKGSRDNIMLSVNYTHVEFDEEQDKYLVIERNKDERDA